MIGRCELFDARGTQCRGSALARCREDGVLYCAAHRGYQRGIPAGERCVACEGATATARREARHVASDQDHAATRIASEPALLAEAVRARGVLAHAGVITRVPTGGWLRSRRTETEEHRFWLVSLEVDADDPSREVGLGLTLDGAWVRHERPAGSGQTPTLVVGVEPTTSGARELVRWLHRHDVALPPI